MFLFVVHPFDVGDILLAGEGDAPTYRVEQIDLQFTILVSGNGMRTWYPNQKLMGMAFANITASGERWDSIKVQIDMDTPAGAIDAVREACEAVVAEHPTEFGDSVNVQLRDAATPMKLTLVIGFKYSHNGADGGRCSDARTLMHVALARALIAAGVNYTNAPTKELAPQPAAVTLGAAGGDVEGEVEILPSIQEDQEEKDSETKRVQKVEDKKAV